jgi:uncharacterized protein (TIGR02594 family)
VTQASEEFPWMPVALSELGTTEEPGDDSNPRVVEYLRSTSLGHAMASDDATPWCSAFVNWCLERVGVVGTGSAAARSWLHWGQRLALPRRGCIAVFSRDGGGHVGFFIRYTSGGILVLGGNQGNQVSQRTYDTSRLLGFRATA